MPSRLPTLPQFLAHGLQPCSSTNPVPDDYTCSICTDPCHASDQIVKPLPCQNCYFHHTCLTTWLTSSAPNHFTCPLDRRPLFRAAKNLDTAITTTTNSTGITISQLHDLLFPNQEGDEEETIHTYMLPSGQILIFILTPSTPVEIGSVFSARALLEMLEREQHAATTPWGIIGSWHHARSFNATLQHDTQEAASANILQAHLSSLAESFTHPPDDEDMWGDVAVVLADLQRRFDGLRDRYLDTVRRKVALLVAALQARLRVVSAEGAPTACAYVESQIAEIETCMAAVRVLNEGMARYVLEDCERTVDIVLRLEGFLGVRGG